MIHICFAYICRYKALRNVGLKIDSRYNYRFDAVNNVLSISEDENYPKRFWGPGLYSLAAIVGNNGAGKSTSRGIRGTGTFIHKIFPHISLNKSHRWAA